MARTVQIIFTGDAAKLKSALGEIEGATSGTEEKVGGLGSSIANVGDTITTFVSIPFAGAMGAATAAAIEDQAAQDALRDALEQTTGATDDQVASVEDWISAQLGAKGFTDDQLRPAMERLTRSTHDIGSAQDILSVAMDVSVRTGKDLATVVEALSKAHDGNTGALRRLGIATTDANGQALDFDGVMQNLSTTMGGAAAEAAGTAAGQLDIAKAKMGEAAESAGAVLVPVMGQVASWVGTAADGFANLSPGMQGVIVKSGLVVAAMGPILSIGGRLIESFKGLTSGISAFTTKIGLTNTALLGVGAAAAGAVGVFYLLERSQNRAEEAARKLGDALAQEADGVVDAVKDHVAATLAANDLGEAYQRAGIDYATLDQALRSGTNQFEALGDALGTPVIGLQRLSERMAAAPGEWDPAVRALVEAGTSGKLTEGELLDLARTLDHLSDAFDDNRESAAQQTAATQAVNTAMGKAVLSTKGMWEEAAALDAHLMDLRPHTAAFSGEIETAGDRADDAARRVSLLNDQLDRLVGIPVDTTLARIDFQQQIEGYDESTESVGRLIQQLTTLTQSVIDGGGSPAEVAFAWETGLAQIEQRTGLTVGDIEQQFAGLDLSAAEAALVQLTRERHIPVVFDMHDFILQAQREGAYTHVVPVPGHVIQLAESGTVKARPGGTMVNLAEAGRDESVVDTGKLNALLDRAGGASVTVHVHGSVLTDRDLARVVRTQLVDLQRRSGALGLS